MTSKSVAAIVLAMSFVMLTQTATADEPGEDNPLVSRFEGAVMHAYEESDYDEVALPRAPVPRASYGSGGKNSEAAKDAVLPLEGRITWIAYRAPEGKSTLEILRNYESALTADGFEVLFSCRQQDECGPGIGRYVRNIAYPDGFWSRKPMFLKPGYVVSGNTRALLASREDENGAAHVFLYIQDDKRANIHQVVVEGEAMQLGQVETGVRTAGELQAALDAEGRVVVEGIYFEFDKAEIRPESAEALEQMAALMKDAADIQVYIVGHTDNQGSLDYNHDLSARRAEAVRRALAGEYGIDAGRMAAHGVASLAPVASNGTEDGRALNRRVELVLQ